MTFKELKQRFENLGYDLEYKTSTEGRGYYLREYGTTGFSIYENSRAAIEAKLDLLEMKENEFNMYQAV